MSKLPLAALAAMPSLLCAAEETPDFSFDIPKSYAHTLQPKIFYRYHQEGKDVYKLSGVGVQYQFDPGVGFTYKVQSLSNLSNKKPFFVGSSAFGWKFRELGNYQIFTNLESQVISHMMSAEEGKEFHAHKTTLFLGVGMQYQGWSLMQPFVELGPMKDTSNSLVAHHGEFFSGKHYYNPWAGQVKVGIESKLENGNSFFLEGFYAHSEKGCYQSCGAEISIKWCF